MATLNVSGRVGASKIKPESWWIGFDLKKCSLLFWVSSGGMADWRHVTGSSC